MKAGTTTENFQHEGLKSNRQSQPSDLCNEQGLHTKKNLAARLLYDRALIIKEMSGFHEVEAMVQRRRAAEEGVEVLRRRVGALNESRTGLASTLLELRAQYSALSKDNATMNASSQQSHEDMARAAEPLAAVEEGIRVVELFVLFEGGPRGVFNGSPTDGVSEGCGGHDRDGNCGRGVASVASVLAPEGGEEPVTSEGQSHSQAKVHVDDQAETSGTLPCLVDQARQLADKGTAGAAQAHQIVREGMHTHTLIEEEREMLQMYVAATTSAQTETQKHEAACKSAVAKRRQLEAELKSKREALALFRKEGVGGELGGSDKTRREALYHQASVAEQTARTQNESSKAADVRWRERKEAASQGEGARDQELGDRVRAGEVKPRVAFTCTVVAWFSCPPPCLTKRTFARSRIHGAQQSRGSSPSSKTSAHAKLPRASGAQNRTRAPSASAQAAATAAAVAMTKAFVSAVSSAMMSKTAAAAKAVAAEARDWARHPASTFTRGRALTLHSRRLSHRQLREMESQGQR